MRARKKRLRDILSPEDVNIARDMGEIPNPKPHPRRWERVGPVVAGLIFLGFIIG